MSDAPVLKSMLPEDVSEYVNTRNVIAIRDYTILSRRMVEAQDAVIKRLENMVLTYAGRLDAAEQTIALLRARVLGGGPTSGNIN